jgi:hypothetical protein
LEPGFVTFGTGLRHFWNHVVQIFLLDQEVICCFPGFNTKHSNSLKHKGGLWISQGASCALYRRLYLTDIPVHQRAISIFVLKDWLAKNLKIERKKQVPLTTKAPLRSRRQHIGWTSDNANVREHYIEA